MFQLTDIILNGTENGKHTGLNLIDLRKAFDILSHKILLGKMNCIGFPDKSTKWFLSYLTNRVIFVSLSTVCLEAGVINCGVSQQSILGLLLFLLYINDIPQVLLNNPTYLYADDTIIFCQHKNNMEIKNVLNKEFRMYAIGLLTISYQFVLVKIKQNAFFSVAVRTYLIPA